MSDNTVSKAIEGLPFPVIHADASVRVVLDLSKASDKEIAEIPDMGLDFQNIDHEKKTLTLVIALDDGELDLDHSQEEG